jgi:hypothetical protein
VAWLLWRRRLGRPLGSGRSRRGHGGVHHDADDEALALLAVARRAADEAEEAWAVEAERGGAVGEGGDRLRGVAGVEGRAVHQQHRVIGVLEVCQRKDESSHKHAVDDELVNRKLGTCTRSENGCWQRSDRGTVERNKTFFAVINLISNYNSFI